MSPNETRSQRSPAVNQFDHPDELHHRMHQTIASQCGIDGHIITPMSTLHTLYCLNKLRALAKKKRHEPKPYSPLDYCAN
jgi:hypothetical protein